MTTGFFNFGIFNSTAIKPETCVNSEILQQIICGIFFGQNFRSKIFASKCDAWAAKKIRLIVKYFDSISLTVKINLPVSL